MTSTIAEERWTPTTIQTAFVLGRLQSQVSRSRLRTPIPIDLPLPSLGWTFALSLIPIEKPYWGQGKSLREVDKWIPAAFSFKQHGSVIRWRSASIRAELSLGEEGAPGDESTPSPLGAMNIVLAETPALRLPLTTSCTILPSRPKKVWLTVTISNCPLSNGFFGARLGPIYEAQALTHFVRQSGGRLLSRSLSTGVLFDVKFLTPSTRSTSGNTGKFLPTYASHLVLEGHIDSSAILGERWTSVLAALDSTDVNNLGEISCPDDYDHELDSDYDEDEPSPLHHESGCESDQAIPRDRSSTPIPLHMLILESETDQSESDTEMPSDSLSEGASEHGSVNHLLEEATKDLKELPSEYERTVCIKFAAHRTWHAFLLYCYTGCLEFGKLKSQVEPGGRYLRTTPLECSPKSMYRLADLVGNKDLKAKALAAIKERTTETNVLDEVFSVFTSKYSEIRQVQLDILMEHRKSPKVKEAFLRVMKEYGSMPHAQAVLSVFYDDLVRLT